LSGSFVIERALAGHESMRTQRHHFVWQVPRHHSAPRRDWRAMIPAGFELRPVDSALLAETHLDHLDALKEELVSECPSVDFFLAHRFGVCLVSAGELAAWCLAEHNVGDRCEVGIETQPSYRQRGFATITASALVETAAARGITRVGWHCYERNQASIATALKVGFQETGAYPVYFVRSAPASTNGGPR
jgi:RimJ/RimL family protein N-acetyltransferase